MEEIGGLFLPKTVFGSKEWVELEEREFKIGPENLLEEILKKKLWSNAEVVWVVKRMVFYYGQRKSFLNNAPVERILHNMNDVLRVFYLLFDLIDPELDDNVRSYICSKLADASWGINANTREYLIRMQHKEQ